MCARESAELQLGRSAKNLPNDENGNDNEKTQKTSNTGNRETTEREVTKKHLESRGT